MSEENLTVLRKGYAAVNRGDIDGFLATVHPDVEFTSLIAEAEARPPAGTTGSAVVDGGCPPARRPARGA